MATPLMRNVQFRFTRFRFYSFTERTILLRNLKFWWIQIWK